MDARGRVSDGEEIFLPGGSGQFADAVAYVWGRHAGDAKARARKILGVKGPPVDNSPPRARNSRVVPENGHLSTGDPVRRADPAVYRSARFVPNGLANPPGCFPFGLSSGGAE